MFTTRIWSPLARFLGTSRCRFTVVATGLFTALVGIGYFCYLLKPAWDYRVALSEADRLDPGWRLEELEARRRTVSDQENAALVVLEMALEIPSWDWQGESRVGFPLPPVLLAAHQEAALEYAVCAAHQGLAKADGLAKRPRGRFAHQWKPDFFSTPFDYATAVRKTALALSDQAFLQAQRGETEQALQSTRLIVHVSRSVGDEPTLLGMLVRIVACACCLERLEQVLAVAQPAAAQMKALELLLEEDEKEPLLLIAVRGERAGLQHFFEGIDSGAVSPKSVASLMSSPPENSFVNMTLREYLPFTPRLPRAELIHHLNDFVEIAKKPAEEQPALVADLNKRRPRLGGEPFWGDAGDLDIMRVFHCNLARLRCARVALAAERFRLQHGRWPQRLTELGPKYLKEVPLDPYDGQPLRYRQLADGVVVYCLGPDAKDDGGKIDRRNPIAPGSDLGFQLWDVHQRRQAPQEEPDEK